MRKAWHERRERLGLDAPPWKRIPIESVDRRANSDSDSERESSQAADREEEGEASETPQPKDFGLTPSQAAAASGGTLHSDAESRPPGSSPAGASEAADGSPAPTGEAFVQERQQQQQQQNGWLFPPAQEPEEPMDWVEG